MNWYKKAQQKVLFVIRGAPGSGKSTLAKQLGQGGVVLSGDDFFMIEGQLPTAKAWACKGVESC